APAEVYDAPATPFVASFLGASNFWDAEVREVSGEGLALGLPGTGGIGITVPAPPGRAFAAGEAVGRRGRPEKLVLSVRAPEGGPAFPVTVVERIYQGASTTWIVRDERGERFTVYSQNAGGMGESLEPGSGGFLSWEARNAVVLGRSVR